MKIDTRFFLFLIQLIILGGCLPSLSPNPWKLYEEPRHGIRFELSDLMIRTTKKDLWGFKEWKHPQLPLTFTFKAGWNQDLRFFPLDICLDMYFSSYRSKYPQSTLYVDSIIPFILSSGIQAIGFNAIDGDTLFQGIYTVENNRYYMIFLKYPKEMAEKKEVKELWSRLKKTLSIIRLPDHRKYLKHLLNEKQGEEKVNIKDILDYGQQLMSLKEAYSKNYPQAIMEFRKALGIMENMTPKPSEFHRALRLIFIARELQRKAYEKHYTLLTAAVKLFKWEEARKEALILLELLSDDRENPQAKGARDNYRFVMKSLSKAQKQE